jgi:hypothetical protein
LKDFKRSRYGNQMNGKCSKNLARPTASDAPAHRCRATRAAAAMAFAATLARGA